MCIISRTNSMHSPRSMLLNAHSQMREPYTCVCACCAPKMHMRSLQSWHVHVWEACSLQGAHTSGRPCALRYACSWAQAPWYAPAHAHIWDVHALHGVDSPIRMGTWEVRSPRHACVWDAHAWEARALGCVLLGTRAMRSLLGPHV